MALLSNDPARLRIGGGAFVAAVPVLLWLAYDFRRDDSTFSGILLVMAAAALGAAVWVLRRASSGTKASESDLPSGTGRVLLTVLPFGWLAFGIAYGLLDGNMPAFWLSLIPTAITAGVAIYAWRGRQRQ